MITAYLLVVVLLIALTNSQTCTIQDNTDFDNGYKVMLYGIQSAQDCCAACSSFEECTYFSYIKDPNAGMWYQRCFIKTDGTGQKQDNAVTAGHNSRPPAPPSNCTMQDNVDYDNGWLSLVEKVESAGRCCELCSYYPGCNIWTYIKDPNAGAWYQRCFFKSDTTGMKTNAGTTSGAVSGRAPVGPPRKSKRGLAWFNSQLCSDLKLMKSVSWFYNWSPTPDQNLLPCMKELGIEFVPMQWGGGGIADLAQEIYADTQHLIAFNEPNFHAQSNILPQQAAQLWPQLEAIATKHNLKLGSPSAAACGPNPQTDCYGASWDPEPWFDAFFGNCTGCKVDFLTSHIYTCNITELQSFLTKLKKYNLPIWLTEFACPAAKQPESVELAFMKDALNYLENEPSIERYAWFGTRLDPTDGWLGPQVDLLSDTGCALSDLGQLYNSM